MLCLFTYNLFAQRETILVIESYHGEYPWDQSYKEGLREVLASKYDLVFFEMNTKQFVLLWLFWEMIMP